MDSFKIQSMYKFSDAWAAHWIELATQTFLLQILRESYRHSINQIV